MKTILPELTKNIKHFKIFTAFIFGMLLHSSLVAQNWQLIEPKYPTIDDVVIAYSVADFGITGDGVTDVTQDFQNLLNQLSEIGGGVLFVPEGKYVVKGNLLLPKGITLRGEWKKPVKGEPIVGTILMAYAGRGQEDGTPFITMETSAAVMDLAIWYPEQTPGNITPYPPSVVFGKPNYFGNEFCNAKNITLVNSYAGIVFSRKNGGTCPTINGVYGTPLFRGVEIDNIVDVGRIEWIDFSPDYWSGSGLENAPSKGGDHENWIYENGTGIVMRRNDWSYTCFVNIGGYNKGFHAVESITSPGAQPNGHNYSMTFTNCKTGVAISGANSVGLMFTGIKTMDCETGIGIAKDASGVAQFHTCELDATKNAIAVDEAASTRLMFLQSEINNGSVDVRGGTFTVTDCDFNNLAPQISIKKNAKAIITGNRFAQEVQIEEGSIFENIIDHTPVTMNQMPEVVKLKPETHKPLRLELYLATDSPFNATGNGYTDDTDAIQLALDQAATDGGGIVFLPPGKYKVLGNLVIPSGVELKGAVDVSTTPTGPGSVLEIYDGRNNPDAEPFMKLSENSGVRGIVFNYPEQVSTDLPNIATYPYCVQATGSDTYMINIGMRGVDKGVDLFTHPCHNHYIDFLAGHAFNIGIRVGGGTMNGKIYNTQFNVIAYACGSESKYGGWPNSPDAGNSAAYDYGFDHFNFMILGDCQNQLLYNDFHYGSHNGLELTSEDGIGPSGMSIGYGIDGSRNALIVDGVGNGGFDFINSQIVSIGDQNTKYIHATAGFSSEINFFNLDLWGNPTQGILQEGGTLNFQQANFNQPGQQRLATITNGTLNIESSAVWPVNNLLTYGTESHLSIHSSIVDPSGITKGNCALWENNLSNAPVVSTASAISRNSWTVSASTNNSAVHNAVDGFASSRWDTNGSQQPGQWFTINFGKPEKIEQILLDVVASPSDSPQKFDFLVSDNGTDWYGPAVSGSGADVMTIISFPTTTVQYVRVVQTGAKGNWWSMHEVNAFGDESAISLDGISLETDKISLAFDSTYQINPTILPADADNKTIFWKSSNNSVATVDEIGLVTGVSTGTAKITAITMDGIKKSSLQAYVSEDGTTSAGMLAEADFGLNLYPNPAEFNVNLSFNLETTENISLNLMNMNGVCIKSESVNANAGFNQIGFNMDGVSPGVYFVSLVSENGNQTKRLVVR
ncbi:glycosyl hydrolase family 28-related protein [Sunxiuqinia sp. A32]|uniref:glycosyl hydrolase family 28-related protein n=1 Tax=Sunxiuqinia sp. A32 TaxID=3461496 RepID=UPI0040467F5F